MAGVPVLQADDVACFGINVAETGLNLLADHGRTVVALEAEPGDVGVGVVVTVDLHVRSLFVSPESDDACQRSIASIREVVEDHEAVRGDAPLGWAGVASSPVVVLEERVLDVALGSA